MKDGSTCNVEELYYTDMTKHWYHWLSGNTNKRHFNNENRITKINGDYEIFNGKYDPYNIIEDHIFEHAASIEYKLPTPSGQTNPPLSKKVVVKEELNNK